MEEKISRDAVKQCILSSFQRFYSVAITEDSLVDMTWKDSLPVNTLGIKINFPGLDPFPARQVINYFYCVVVMQEVMAQKEGAKCMIADEALPYAMGLDLEAVFAKVCEDCLADLGVKPLPMSHYYQKSWSNFNAMGFCKFTADTIENIRKEKTAET